MSVSLSVMFIHENSQRNDIKAVETKRDFRADKMLKISQFMNEHIHTVKATHESRIEISVILNGPK